MIDSLAAAITVAALLGGIAVATASGAGRYRWRTTRWGLAGLQVAVTVQAVLAVVGLARGHLAREPAVHLAYLAVSVLLVPVAVSQVRRGDDRWSAVLVVVALLVLAVVVVRAQSTWRSP